VRILAKFSLRHVTHRPLRALLTLASVVIGVGAVVAVMIATATTRRAYYELFSTVTGRTALEIVAEGEGTFDEKVLAAVERAPGVTGAAPVLQRPTVMYYPRQQATAGDQLADAGEKATARGRVKLFMLGIDPLRDGAVRDYTIHAGRMLRPGEAGVLLEAGFAQRLGLKVNDRVRLLSSAKPKDATLVGLLSLEGAESLRLAGVAFVPLQKAQEWCNCPGEVDAIHVVVGDESQERPAQEHIAAELPVGLTCRRPVARTQIMDETLKGSSLGMLWATGFALLLSAFIILNTFLMNIGERRQQMAVMRTVGATQRQLTRMVLGESALMGLLGTAIGIAAGLVGAYFLSRAMNDLMQIAQPPLKLTWPPFALALVAGPLVAMLGAALPAWRAGQLSPLEGLSSVPHGDIEGSSHRFTLAGVLMALIAIGTLTLCLNGRAPPLVSVVAAMGLMVAAVLLLPEVLAPLSHAMAWLLRPAARIESHLAHLQVLRHRTRSTLTVGVLFIACGAGVGVANAILDNVQDIREWYERTLVGDFFIRALMPDMTSGAAPDIPEAMGAEIARVPGIAELGKAKFVQATAAGQAAVIIVRDFKPDHRLHLDLRGQDPDQVRDRLFAGGVIVGTVLAQNARLGVGDQIAVETREGTRHLPIVALTNEYLVGGLAIYMEWGLGQRLLNVAGVSAYIVRTDPDARAEVQAELETLCEKYGVLLHPYADVATMIDGMITSINGALWGIIVLSFIVAAIGVVNTLTMNVLEQTRELGLLRIVAMTRGQVRRTIFAQAAIMGGIGLVPGVATAVLVGFIMHLAMMTILGHPVPYVFRPGLLGGSLGAGMAVVLAAAWLPAERAARLVLSKALQYE